MQEIRRERQDLQFRMKARSVRGTSNASGSRDARSAEASASASTAGRNRDARSAEGAGSASTARGKAVRGTLRPRRDAVTILGSGELVKPSGQARSTMSMWSKRQPYARDHPSWGALCVGGWKPRMHAPPPSPSLVSLPRPPDHRPLLPSKARGSSA